MATPEEQAIQGVIDQIWDTYDVDKSGALDKDETKKFVQDTLGNLGAEYDDGETNEAGWMRGVGYCDAQCPTDLNFVQGSG